MAARSTQPSGKLSPGAQRQRSSDCGQAGGRARRAVRRPARRSCCRPWLRNLCRAYVRPHNSTPPTHLQVGLERNGLPLCILHHQPQWLLQLRHHAHKMLLAHCGAGQGAATGQGQGDKTARCSGRSAACSAARQPRRTKLRHACPRAPLQAMAISSREWPSGLRSATKTLTATRARRQDPPNTSPLAPSPVVGAGRAGRGVSGRAHAWQLATPPRHG